VALFASPDTNRRIAHERAHLTVAGGMPQDGWARAKTPKPEKQLTSMQGAVAELLANGQALSLFGDNLFFDLDLSARNLPTGSRLRAGDALLEVTPEPHDGCSKFKARFGSDALRLVARKSTRDLNLRGIYLTVLEDGDVAPGDTIQVTRR
jgi:MOSC domain-containing protein YiiM